MTLERARREWEIAEFQVYFELRSARLDSNDTWCAEKRGIENDINLSNETYEEAVSEKSAQVAGS